MLCIICIENKAANEFICPYCKSINVLDAKQLTVDNPVRERFFSQTFEEQNHMIKLVAGRLRSLVTYGILWEFNLNSIIKEYLEMNELGLKEIPQDDDRSSYFSISYHQYQPPKQGV